MGVGHGRGGTLEKIQSVSSDFLDYCLFFPNYFLFLHHSTHSKHCQSSWSSLCACLHTRMNWRAIWKVPPDETFLISVQICLSIFAKWVFFLMNLEDGCFMVLCLLLHHEEYHLALFPSHEYELLLYYFTVL